MTIPAGRDDTQAALGEAYHDAVKHLFEVYRLKLIPAGADRALIDKQFETGLDIAVEAHARASALINKRFKERGET